MDKGEALRRLGEIIKDRRVQLFRAQEDAASATDGFVSENYWWQLENGRAANPQPKTLRAVDAALGWQRGTLEGMLADLLDDRAPEVPVDPQPGPPDLEKRVGDLEEELRGLRTAVERLSSHVAAVTQEVKRLPRRKS